MSEPFRRLGLLGDVHAESEALRRASWWLRAMGCEALLCVGDVADGPGSLDETCRLLAGGGVLAVKGNHDRWLLEGTMRDLPGATPLSSVSEEARGFLAGLPATRHLETTQGSLLLCHGVGPDDMVKLRPDDEGYAIEANLALQALIRSGEHRLVVGGHTHRRMVRSFGSLTVVNAGALLTDHKGQAGFALLDLEAGEVRFLDLRDGDATPAGTWDLTGHRRA